MFKGRHFDAAIILPCVRWYLAYGLSLRDLEEMIGERGICVDHSTIHRWVVRYAPKLLDAFNARKQPVMKKWHVDETYIKVRGEWTYLYRAVDKGGATVDFLFSKTRNLNDAKRFFRQAYERHGLPEQVTIDGSQTNLEAARRCQAEVRMQGQPGTDPLKVRQSQYMNNRIEQDHRRIKRRIRSMPSFKSEHTATVILGGVELVHMIRKGQMVGSDAQNPSLAEQFNRLAA